MAAPDLPRLSQLTNEADAALDRGTERDIQSAMRISCSFLDSLSRSEIRGDGGRVRIPTKVDFAGWATRQLEQVTADPAAVADLFADPEAVNDFFDMEDRLLRQAGLNGSVVDWLIPRLRDSAGSALAIPAETRRLQAGLEQLRMLVCSQVSWPALTRAILDDVPMPSGHARKALVFALGSTVVTVSNALLLTSGGVPQATSLRLGMGGFALTASSLYDAVNGKPY